MSFCDFATSKKQRLLQYLMFSPNAKGELQKIKYLHLASHAHTHSVLVRAQNGYFRVPFRYCSTANLLGMNYIDFLTFRFRSHVTFNMNSTSFFVDFSVWLNT